MKLQKEIYCCRRHLLFTQNHNVSFSSLSALKCRLIYIYFEFLQSTTQKFSPCKYSWFYLIQKYLIADLLLHTLLEKKIKGKKSQREDVFLNVLTVVYIYTVTKPMAIRELVYRSILCICLACLLRCHNKNRIKGFFQMLFLQKVAVAEKL